MMVKVNQEHENQIRRFKTMRYKNYDVIIMGGGIMGLPRLSSYDGGSIT